MAKLYCNRAQAKSKQDDSDGAIADCTQCVRCNPRFLKGWLRRAEFNMAKGGKEAIAQCIEVSPHSSSLFLSTYCFYSSLLVVMA